MGREERRRAERERRRQGRPASGLPSNVPGWTPPPNQVTSAKWVPSTPQETERQRQDFLAGTVFVTEDAQTFGPAPQLREAFRLLDQHGGAALHDMITVGTAWGALDGPTPLVKLKLEFHDQPPLRGKVEIVLMAENYRDSWRHIAGGGLVAVSTLERMQAATNRPGASFADGMEAALLFGIGSSPVVQHLIDAHGW